MQPTFYDVLHRRGTTTTEILQRSQAMAKVRGTINAAAGVAYRLFDRMENSARNRVDEILGFVPMSDLLQSFQKETLARMQREGWGTSRRFGHSDTTVIRATYDPRSGLKWEERPGMLVTDMEQIRNFFDHDVYQESIRAQDDDR